MNVQGERILIFGDSLSHPGPDGAPYIFNVDPGSGSNRSSSSPGDLVASMLLEQGAEAVQIDSRVGRNAINFWGREDTTTLLAADAAFAPTKVVVILGTNDIGVDSDRETEAFTQIRDTYRAMGAEVWAVGPFFYVGQAQGLNDGAQAVLNLMAGVFGADKTIDGRPLSVNVQRTGDGVHFTPASAAPTAANITNALISQNPLNIGYLLGWVLLGLGGIAALAWGAKKFDAWHEGRGLDGATDGTADLNGLEGLDYDDFYRTGKQDCGNTLSVDEIDLTRGDVDTVVEAYADEYLSDSEAWLEQQELGPEDIAPEEAFKAWRQGYKECAKKHVARMIEESKDTTEQFWLKTKAIGGEYVENFDTFEAAFTELNKLPEGVIEIGTLNEKHAPTVTKWDNGDLTWHSWGSFTNPEQDKLKREFPRLVPHGRGYPNAVTIANK